MDKSQIENLVFRAIERTNEVLPEGSSLTKARSQAIAGRNSNLDSMGMVNLVFALEDEMLRHLKLDLNLAEAKDETGQDPLETVGSLIDYLARVAEKEG